MTQYAIGLMSGTSGDGLSLALCSFNNKQFDLVKYHTYPYPKNWSRDLTALRTAPAGLVSHWNIRLGRFFADKTRHFIRHCPIPAKAIRVIGSHGHTAYHSMDEKNQHTLQIGEPSFIAQATGIPVVADFRMADIAAGGQGAPLIPYFDAFFYGNGEPVALQNLGGIGNVSILGKGLVPLAYDTGPGMCLIDLYVKHKTRGRLQYDRGGKLAQRGAIDMRSVREMHAHPYFKRRPPKSTGRELFNQDFIPRRLFEDSLEGGTTTLTFLTAWSIAKSLEHFTRVNPARMLVSGGGALNQTLLNFLNLLLYPCNVLSIEEEGLPAQAKEPAAFAFFAWRAINRHPNHLPRATGAKQAVHLGKLVEV